MSRGEPGIEAMLIEALNIYGHKEMAQAFLNSNNKRLKEAGQKWFEMKYVPEEDHD